MRERVLLDLRGKAAQLLPFRNAVRLAVTLEPQIPQPAVMEFSLGDAICQGFSRSQHECAHADAADHFLFEVIDPKTLQSALGAVVGGLFHRASPPPARP
jgi:hypothetical protein